MKRLGLVIVLALSLAGCSATKKAAANLSTAQEAAALTGNWVGTATPAPAAAGNLSAAVGSIPVQMSSQDGQYFNLTLDLSAFNPACENAMLGFTADLYPGPTLVEYSSFGLPNMNDDNPSYVMFSPATDDIGLYTFSGNFPTSTTSLSMNMILRTQFDLSTGLSTSSCVPPQSGPASAYIITLTKQ